MTTFIEEVYKISKENHKINSDISSLLPKVKELIMHQARKGRFELDVAKPELECSLDQWTNLIFTLQEDGFKVDLSGCEPGENYGSRAYIRWSTL